MKLMPSVYRAASLAVSGTSIRSRHIPWMMCSISMETWIVYLGFSSGSRMAGLLTNGLSKVSLFSSKKHNKVLILGQMELKHPPVGGISQQCFHSMWSCYNEVYKIEVTSMTFIHGGNLEATKSRV